MAQRNRFQYWFAYFDPNQEFKPFLTKCYCHWTLKTSFVWVRHCMFYVFTARLQCYIHLTTWESLLPFQWKALLQWKWKALPRWREAKSTGSILLSQIASQHVKVRHFYQHLSFPCSSSFSLLIPSFLFCPFCFFSLRLWSS